MAMNPEGGNSVDNADLLPTNRRPRQVISSNALQYLSSDDSIHLQNERERSRYVRHNNGINDSDDEDGAADNNGLPRRSSDHITNSVRVNRYNARYSARGREGGTPVERAAPIDVVDVEAQVNAEHENESMNLRRSRRYTTNINVENTQRDLNSNRRYGRDIVGRNNGHTPLMRGRSTRTRSFQRITAEVENDSLRENGSVPSNSEAFSDAREQQLQELNFNIERAPHNIADTSLNAADVSYDEATGNDNAERQLNSNQSIGPMNMSTSVTSTIEKECATSKVRILKELQEIISNPPPNCSAGPKDDNIYEWTSTILGPQGTVYEDGVFRLDILFPKDYPYQPPSIRFRTLIYHCNISRNGFICLDTLKNNWSPALSISGVLLSISSFLTDCNPYDPLVAEIAKEYLEDRQKYDRTAKKWTRLYAQN